MTHTHTYTILDVAETTYRDVRDRIERAVGKKELESYYLTTDRGGAELIVLSTIALRAEGAQDGKP
jgi:hypothetical protein